MSGIYKIVSLMLMIAILAVPSKGLANDEPEVDMWFTWKEENEEWHDWVGCTQENRSILYNLQLKVRQPVKCKVKIVPHRRRGLVCLELTEPGTTNAYNVTSGKKQGNTIYINGSINEPVEYEWTLQPNGKWTGGNAPINIYWEILYVEGSDPSGSYAFANPTIIDEEWQGGDSGNGGGDNGKDNDNDGIPGFESASLGVAMLIALAVWQMKRKRWRE